VAAARVEGGVAAEQESGRDLGGAVQGSGAAADAVRGGGGQRGVQAGPTAADLDDQPCWARAGKAARLDRLQPEALGVSSDSGQVVGEPDPAGGPAGTAGTSRS
jgi:hypothetical protein